MQPAKVVKAATAGSPDAAPSTCNASAKRKKGKRKKSLTPEPEAAPPRPTTFPQYEAVRCNDWRRNLRDDQVSDPISKDNNIETHLEDQ